MNKQQFPAGDEPAAEACLGRVLALIHRVLPRLDEAARAIDVQRALRQALEALEAARAAHEQWASLGSTPAQHRVATGVSPEIAAVIAAAVAVMFDQPYRLVSVQKVETPVPHLNVWALEGRTQLLQSHKIR